MLRDQAAEADERLRKAQQSARGKSVAAMSDQEVTAKFTEQTAP
jgi:hypothetical protein